MIYAYHLNGAAEGQLSVSLGEVKVTQGQVGSFNVDWEVATRAAAEVLDVDVSSVLTARNGSSSLFVDLLPNVVGEVLSHIGALGLRRKGHIGDSTRVGSNQTTLALVPSVEEFLAWCSSDEPGMRNSSEPHPRDVATGRVHAFKVPNGLAGLGIEVVGE
jgi:hypothetical protein